jgi:hypothetical protein
LCSRHIRDIFMPCRRASFHQACDSQTPALYLHTVYVGHTVRKKDLILRSLERRLQMQFSMARKFPLWPLRRYNVKHSKMRNFTFGAPWPLKINTFLPNCTVCVILRANEYKMAENALSIICCLNLLLMIFWATLCYTKNKILLLLFNLTAQGLVHSSHRMLWFHKRRFFSFFVTY